MASLRRIEELMAELQKYHIPTEPSWIRGYMKSSISKKHLSGRLREASEDKNLPMEIECLLDEAAETLDDAHEEWLENKLIAYRRLRYGI